MPRQPGGGAPTIAKAAQAPPKLVWNSCLRCFKRTVEDHSDDEPTVCLRSNRHVNCTYCRKVKSHCLEIPRRFIRLAAKWQQHVRDWHKKGGRRLMQDVDGRNVNTAEFVALAKKQKKLNERIAAYMRSRGMRNTVPRPKTEEDFRHSLLVVLSQIERHLSNMVHIKRVEARLDPVEESEEDDDDDEEESDDNIDMDDE